MVNFPGGWYYWAIEPNMTTVLFRTCLIWLLIAAEFDFCKGGLLSIGMAVLLVAPPLVAKVRGLV